MLRSSIGHATPLKFDISDDNSLWITTSSDRNVLYKQYIMVKAGKEIVLF